MDSITGTWSKLTEALRGGLRAFVSARMGVIKPDSAIYAQVEAEGGLAPDEMIFTDDRPENIDAAAARGWRVHLFTDWQGWADRLVAEGLLSRSEAGR